jgi:hypothetical protein
MVSETGADISCLGPFKLIAEYLNLSQLSMGIDSSPLPQLRNLLFK